MTKTSLTLDLSRGVESNNPFDALRSLRRVRRERLQKDLFLKAKDAKLRSGARGMQARKALIAAEKTVAEFDVLYAAVFDRPLNMTWSSSHRLS